MMLTPANNNVAAFARFARSSEHASLRSARRQRLNVIRNVRPPSCSEVPDDAMRSRSRTFRLTCSLLAAFFTVPCRPGLQGQQIEHWHVRAVPELSIGELEGAEEQILVAPQAGTVLTDGTVVIQNSLRGLFEIRYYSSTGQHLRTASRWGQGPFEFHFALGLHRLPGDSLLVVGQLDRLAVFGPEGDRVREGRAGLRPVVPLMRSILVDAHHIALLKSVESGLPEPGAHRSRTLVLLHDLTSHQTDTVTTVLGRNTHYELMRNRSGVSFHPMPFSPQTHVAGGSGYVWIGDFQEPDIRGFRPGGEGPTTIIEVDRQAQVVTREDQERLQHVYATQSSGDTQRRWARFARSMEFPDRMPYFGDIQTDQLGNIWVQDYEPPWTTGPQRWDVYSPLGYRIATAELPETSLPACARGTVYGCGHLGGILEIGDDYLLVRQQDHLGVTRVAKYTLLK